MFNNKINVKIYFIKEEIIENWKINHYSTIIKKLLNESNRIGSSKNESKKVLIININVRKSVYVFVIEGGGESVLELAL